MKEFEVFDYKWFKVNVYINGKEILDIQSNNQSETVPLYGAYNHKWTLLFGQILHLCLSGLPLRLSKLNSFVLDCIKIGNRMNSCCRCIPTENEQKRCEQTEGEHRYQRP